jgi:signal transduction histidine kinase
MSSAAVKKVSLVKGGLSSMEAPAPNRRLLIVDDEVQIADSLRQILSPPAGNLSVRRSSRSSQETVSTSVSCSPHFDVVVCHHPKEALEAIEEAVAQGRPFAMGFFDVILGADIDGIELVKRAQSIDPRIYSVFVTAYQDRSVDSISQYLGEENLDRWDYVNKPFTEGEILQKAKHLTSLWDLHRLKEWQEEKLAEAQKLLLHNERQNTVAAVGRGFAHEFGNLLTHIVGNADMALIKNDTERMRSALKAILQASETASSLLGRLKRYDLDPAAEKERLHLINLQFPIEEAIDLMNFQFRKTKIEVVKERFDAVLIEADKHALVQVLMNIFINSGHAMKNGGKIFLQLYKSDENTAKIIVRDTGSGIPEEVLSKVFEPLFTTKGSMGTGLGLAISKEIIEIEHCGELIIGNDTRGGVVVEITLPTRQEEENG